MFEEKTTVRASTIRGAGTFVIVTVCLVVLIAGAVGTAVGTHSETPSQHFTVAVNEDGSANVSLTVTFDLTSEEERDGFRSLETDETAKADFRERFTDRMRSVAEAASEETGREMTVSDPTIELSRSNDGDTGIATMQVTWSNLAAEESGDLVVTQPFTSGFTPSYQFVITAPDGYRLADTSPAPDRKKESQASWSAGTTFEEYRVVIEEVPDEQTETGSPGQPGFGLLAGVFALVATGWAVLRRRN